MLDVILFCRGKLLGTFYLSGASYPFGTPLPNYLFISPKCTNWLLFIHALAALVQAGCGGKIALLGSSVEV